MTTDDPSTFESKSSINVVGYNMTKDCADKIFAQAGFRLGEGRDQVGVIELHDCFAANEVRLALPSMQSSLSHTAQLITYEALGLCPIGDAYKLVDRGDNTVCNALLPRTLRYALKYVLF